MTGSFRELPCRDAGLVPDRDPAVAEVVRVVVRHLGRAAGASHRLVRRRLGDALEDVALRDAILKRARGLDRLDQLLGQVHPAGLVALRGRTRKPQPQAGRVDVAPGQIDGLAEP